MHTLQVLYEDKEFLALDKPAGLNSVILNSGGDSLAALLIAKYPKLAEVALKPEDAGLLQRLDRETSGVIVAAKNREAWIKAREVLQGEGVSKTYLALVEGKAKENFEIECYLGSPHRGAKKVKVYTCKPAKKTRALHAHSSFELVSFNQDKNCSLLCVRLSSGRRHQVRAHAAWAGHPLIGDMLYGSTRKLNEVLSGSSREFFLHAQSVEFKNPFTESTLRIEAPTSATI